MIRIFSTKIITGFLVSVAAVAIGLPATAATRDIESPLSGMTAVEASKSIQIPTGNNDVNVQQGRYLVALLGCAVCHTEGALIGVPDPAKTLAGSTIGIAYSNPMVNDYPGAVYPANLTPDEKTGLGAWSLAQIVTLLRSGKNRHGRQTMAIMPWTSYTQLNDADALAIASYLKSLPPINNAVPKEVLPGNPAKTRLVHVGLYRSR